MTDNGIDRRDFLKGAAATVALLMAAEGLGASQVFAAGEGDKKPIPGPEVKIGVIGLGQWGKDIVSTLSKIPSAKVTAICDTYEAFVTRAAKTAPDAKTYSDYKELLASGDVEAVIIATPTHLHKEIALAAIAADKHVYCEAPLASSVEDAKAIAIAGGGSKKVFQTGLQGRKNPLYEHVSSFVKSGCLGIAADAYVQSNRRQSWKRMAPSAEREKEMNWRLAKATSTGLVGEIGIHGIDLVNQYLGAVPVSVTGFGSLIAWKDGRDVADTVQCVFEYPKDVRLTFSSTIVSSFGGEYALIQGSESTLMMRENRGWMIKEADSPLIGWEPYARKEQVYDETGICMLADASKILAAGGEPDKDSPTEPKTDPTTEPLYVALEDFTRCIREDSKPAAGALEGLQSAVTVIRANEAIISGSKVAYAPDAFELK